MSEKSFDYRGYIRSQHGDWQLIEDDEDHFRLVTDWAEGDVIFNHIENTEIIELIITDSRTGENKFFLHFEPEDPEHSKQLFREMVQTLDSLKVQKTTEILLCCSAGLTTSFFAEKLNETAKMLGYDYAFSAVSVSEAYEAGADKAMVLVAPQIGYMEDKLKQALPGRPVRRIPTQIFASYDAGACVAFVKEELDNFRQTKEEKAVRHAIGHIHNDKKILTVMTSMFENEARIYYRVYDHGKPVLDQTVIKRTITIQDLEDVIHTQICSCTGEMKVDAVSIAIPGIVREDGLDLPIDRQRKFDLQNGLVNNFNIVRYFNERFPIPVYIMNNTRSAAFGWYAQQEKYRNVIFYSQPRGWAVGGQSMIIDGKIVSGRSEAAGEIKYVVDQFNYSHPLHFNPFDPDDVTEAALHVLSMDIAVADPEVIVIRSEVLRNMDDLKKKLTRCIPEDHIPELVHIDDFNEYVLLGQMILAAEALDREEK